MFAGSEAREYSYLYDAQWNDKVIVWLFPPCLASYGMIVVGKATAGIIAQFPPLTRVARR